jgi:hypothetical protein
MLSGRVSPEHDTQTKVALAKRELVQGRIGVEEYRQRLTRILYQPYGPKAVARMEAIAQKRFGGLGEVEVSSSEEEPPVDASRRARLRW